ncbi:hypothetical protein T265_06577 [Opisthorchis viverrini]|uniref:Uncharacterized protein n=1 Tax=Opisthorchis viverrini TaxID=6198 RepID=A0A074ZJZ3_OPIVI|nr:hypothetical protein T265_06577 [Opisthorchis viverrini]KER26097.1 hypothetical protein T265_06577 [Opisthorchis viverrini]
MKKPSKLYVNPLSQLSRETKHTTLYPPKKKRAINSLKADETIVVLPTNKGRITVILEKAEYIDKANALLNDTTTYRRLQNDQRANLANKYSLHTSCGSVFIKRNITEKCKTWSTTSDFVTRKFRIHSDPALRTDDSVLHASVLRGASARHMAPTTSGISKSVLKPRYPVNLAAFNIHPLKQAGQQAALSLTLDSLGIDDSVSQKLEINIQAQ